MEYGVSSLFDVSHTVAKDIFSDVKYPHDALEKIHDFIIRLGKTLDKSEFFEMSENVWVHKSAKIAPSAYIGAPCIIDASAEVRHCAFIRGDAIVGKGAVVGNSTELKNVILFDGVQAPHYNYVGDSILGYMSHMGAGAITSNVKSDKSLVTVKDEPSVFTGRKKVGAFLGDFAEIGCSSVLCPGSVVGRGAAVYPLSRVRGVVPANSIYKSEGNIVSKK